MCVCVCVCVCVWYSLRNIVACIMKNFTQLYNVYMKHIGDSCLEPLHVKIGLSIHKGVGFSVRLICLQLAQYFTAIFSNSNLFFLKICVLLVSCETVCSGKVLVISGRNTLRTCSVNKIYSCSSVGFGVGSHFGLLENTPRNECDV